jgi:VIT1/CCC1 family predicted Fe2+/Mn2+ transporter
VSRRIDDKFEGELMVRGAAGRIIEWVRPHVPESSDGILTSAGICEGFAAGAMLPWLAMVLIPGPSRAPVTFVIVLLALALTGWISAQMSDVHPARPIIRMASIGALSMLITFIAGRVLHP